MRILVLKDPAIDQNQAEDVAHQYTNFFQTHTGIVPVFQWQDFIYKDIPLKPDNDGDLKPTLTWFKETIKPVYDEHAESIDHVVLWVHRDNWVFKGIWGVNYSNTFSGYQVHLCRFDDHNLSNSFGTLHHEIHHSFDSLVYAWTGIDFQPLFPVADWDDDVTHGGSTPWKYIRYQENADSLTPIAKYLKPAYAARRAFYRKKLQSHVLVLAQQAVVLLRQLLSRKYGSKS